MVSGPGPVLGDCTGAAPNEGFGGVVAMHCQKAPQRTTSTCAMDRCPSVSVLSLACRGLRSGFRNSRYPTPACLEAPGDVASWLTVGSIGFSAGICRASLGGSAEPPIAGHANPKLANLRVYLQACSISGLGLLSLETQKACHQISSS